MIMREDSPGVSSRVRIRVRVRISANIAHNMI